jgi:hypothetical protein
VAASCTTWKLERTRLGYRDVRRCDNGKHAEIENTGHGYFHVSVYRDGQSVGGDSAKTLAAAKRKANKRIR